MTTIQNGTAGFISETAIEYRSSSIVRDHGGEGDFRAGDRMPDLNVPSESGSQTTLLGDWTDARHLAIVIDAREEVRAHLASMLAHARIIHLRAENLDSEGRRLLGQQPKLLIVRPDGYIGFRGALEQLDHWQAYASQDALLWLPSWNNWKRGLQKKPTISVPAMVLHGEDDRVERLQALRGRGNSLKSA